MVFAGLLLFEDATYPVPRLNQTGVPPCVSTLSPLVMSPESESVYNTAGRARGNERQGRHQRWSSGRGVCCHQGWKWSAEEEALEQQRCPPRKHSVF